MLRDIDTPLSVVNGILAGDTAAWEVFVAVYATSMTDLARMYAARWNVDASEADEAVQRIFVAISQRRRHYDRTRGSFRNWLMLLVRSQVADLARAAYARQNRERQGVIHGDIKYGNVLWDAERRQPVLTDLGSVTPLSSAKLPAPSADVFALAALTRRLLPERCLKSGSPWRTVLTEALVADPLLRLPTPGALAQRLCAVFGKRRLASRPIPGCHRLRG